MKDSGIEWVGQMPADWELVKIATLYSIRNTKVSDIDYPPLSVTMQGILPQVETAAKTNDHDNRKLVKKGDFAINSRSDRRGSCGISEHDGSVSLINTVLKPNRMMNSQYYNWLFHTPLFADEFYKWGHGIVDDLWTTGWQEMKKITVPFPATIVQEKIANLLDAKCAEIDALTADIEKQIVTLEQYKRSVITEAVTKGLNPDAEMKESGTEWLGKIPASWEISRIASVYSLRNTKVSDYEYQPLSVTMKGIVPQLETAAKTNAHDDRKLVKVGDFAINSRSDRRGSCGISSMDGSVSLINTILKPLSKMNPRYYNWLFHTESFADEFYKWGHGIVDDLWTTGWQEMKRIIIPFPSLEEQEQIACFLDNKCGEIDCVLQSKQNQRDTLSEYKKSLIYEYVTGKKEVV